MGSTVLGGKVRRQLLIGGLALFAGGVMFFAAAQLYPDQTWDALSAAEDTFSALFPQSLLIPKPRPTQSAIPYTDDEGYAVLSAWKHHWAQAYPVVVRREMRPDPIHKDELPNASWLPSEFREHYRVAIKDLAAKWPQNWIAEERFVPNGEFLIKAEAEIPINDKRPGIPANAAGYFAFSPVGFNHTHSRAAIYVIHRDGRFGEGAIFLLEKNDSGAWEVTGSALMWIT